MEKSIIEVVLQYGGLGAVLLVVGWAYFKKDIALLAEQQKRIDDGKGYAKELQEEQALRIGDAKDFHVLAMKLQESVIAAVNKLSDIVEVFEKRESAREMREDTRGQPYRDLPKGPR
jgi:hypothetical protein